MKCHFIINSYIGIKEYKRQCEEMLSFFNTMRGDFKHGCSIVLHPCNADIEELIAYAPTEDIILAEYPYYQPESLLLSIEEMIDKKEIYLFGNDKYSAELAVRSGFRKKGSSLTMVRSISFDEDKLIAKKMVYANHLQGTFQIDRYPFCASIADSGVTAAIHKREKNLSVRRVKLPLMDDSFIVSRFEEKKAETADIRKANIIIALGKGAEKPKIIDLAVKLAKLIGGEIAVTRPLAMHGGFPMEQLVGISGMIVRPVLCITVGVSGAAAFYAGIEKSRYIVAINNDPYALIMKKADISIKWDSSEILDSMYSLLTERHLGSEGGASYE